MSKNASLVRFAAFLTIICVVAPGCASYHGKPFLDAGAASSLIEHRNSEGLHVAVRDLSGAQRCRNHFDRELTEFGFAPVLVLLELDSRSTSAFNLRKNELNLVLRDGTRLKPAEPMEVIDAVSYSHWRSFFGFLAVLPGFFVTYSVNHANDKLETDYMDKSLRSVRVNPNMRRYHGVVFFRVPEELRPGFSMEDAFVEVTVHREGEEQGSLGSRLEFPVHFSR